MNDDLERALALLADASHEVRPALMYEIGDFLAEVEQRATQQAKDRHPTALPSRRAPLRLVSC